MFVEVTGNVSYVRRSSSISPSMPFTMLLTLSVSAIVLTLVTSLTLPAEAGKAVWFASGSITSCTFMQETLTLVEPSSVSVLQDSAKHYFFFLTSCVSCE